MSFWLARPAVNAAVTDKGEMQWMADDKLQVISFSPGAWQERLTMVQIE